MDITQLRGLFPKIKELPNRSRFFDIDFYSAEDVEYDNNFIEKFLADAVKYTSDKVAQTCEIIK